jgi:uncharacterized membrane protein
VAKPNLVTRLHLLAGAAQAPFLAVALVKVPAGTELAMHWNEQGTTDWAWTTPWAFFIIPAVTILLLAIATMLSARADQNGQEKVRHLLAPGLLGLLLILLLLEIGLILMGLGTDIDLIRVVAPAVGVCLFLLGILLREAERHTYAGLRLPWSIESDKAWRQAHAAAGWTAIATGLVLALLTWLTPYPGTLIGALVPAIGLPVLAGYIVSFGR